MIQDNVTPKAAIFDMDGLMLDTEAPVIPLWIEAAKNSGWEIDDSVPIASIGRDENSMKELFDEKYGDGFPYNTVLQEVLRLLKLEREKNSIRRKPGLIELLDHLKQLNIPMGVATSTFKHIAVRNLTDTGIIHYFSALTFGDEVSRGKPAPDIFLLAAERLGRDPSECVGFEDSDAGLRALAAAGIRSVFIKDIAEPSPEALSTIWRRYGNLAEAIPLFDTPVPEAVSQ
ncbi:HAD family hydrolase [Breznakiella homolactica]|uniref:HAD family phosphatase n=1 Tax=Breznakiella homolactica TaxID=2798577 RepID=A0A7T8BAE5_9SPIR|nr:HAD family phosphatase [Breznakiella homolactica]QQO09291.1 HAD family phosphatase [Breznakiella homolactica]